mmetsp:Transcript_3514/g.7725  ORF Transcript_3514/g.7725 Transcript_3514/m.7725 type:complete len:294 (+) Transcript_3514:61-942(+)
MAGNDSMAAGRMVMDDLMNFRAPAHVRDFSFASGTTFLGGFQEMATVVLGYFLLIRVLKAVMTNRKGLELGTIVTAHSFFLTVVSAALFAGFAVVLFDKARTYSPWEMICSFEFHEDGRLQTLYYLNYLVKWYELLDTVILVLRKKEVIFLHEYHHAATLFLCWIQMDQHSTVQWVPISINLLVHIFMYYYYALASMKIQPWWKRYLTQLQIVQFVVDIAACVYASSHEPVISGLGISRFFPQRPRCNGTLEGATVGVGIIGSYLVLFIIFYANTYYARKAKGSKGSKGSKAQ